MGRTFAFGVGASLCPFTGLDCIAFCIAGTQTELTAFVGNNRPGSNIHKRCEITG